MVRSLAIRGELEGRNRQFGRVSPAILVVLLTLCLSSAAQPTIGTVTPSSGSGGSGTFTFTASDSNGYAAIGTFAMLIDWTTDAGGCSVSYVPSGNALYLQTDDGQGVLGGYAPGSSNTISNSQCTVNYGGTSVAESGNTLSVTLSLTFSTTFVGVQQLWGYAWDTQGNGSGWSQMGTWTAYPASSQLATNLSASPNAGTGTSQLFTFHANDVNGYRYVAGLVVVIPTGTTLTWSNGCAFAYDAGSAGLSIYNDAETGYLASGLIGSATTLSNDQCSIDLAQSSFIGSGNDAYLNVAVTFPTTFAGEHGVYQDTFDRADASTSFQSVGTWTVGASQFSADSVTPSSGSGNSGIFTFTASDPSGYAAIGTLEMLVNWTTDAGGCSVNYVQSGNALYLTNDDGTQWLGGYAPGSSNTISNSQCTLNYADSSVVAFGDTVGVALSLTFSTTFVGLQQLWAYAWDTQGNGSGWSQLGTWTTYPASSELPTNLSDSPTSGTGTSQLLTFHANDVNGYRYIAGFVVNVSPGTTLTWSNGCAFAYDSGSAGLSIYNDAETGYLASGLIGSSTTLSNDQCSIDLAQSSFTGNGNDAYLNVAVTFPTTFAGEHGVYQDTFDRADASTGFQSMSTWTVPYGTVPTPTFNPQAGAYTSSQSVAINYTSGATVRYTTNGAAPSETSGTIYSGPITVSSSQTIMAIAYEAGWTDSAIASATYTITAPSTASYTVQSSQGGLSILVDAVQYTAPQTFQWVPGTVHTIAVNGATQPGATGVQYSYANWSDLGEQSHSIVAPTGGAVYTANFTTQYYLTMSPPLNYIPTETPEGTVYPASGWYNAGSAVQISAVPAKNFLFTGFSGTGGIQATTSPYVFTITQPTTISSTFGAAQLVVSTPSPLPSAKVGVPYSLQLAATGGLPFYTGYSYYYKWFVLGNTTLPLGLSLTSTGLLQGTPIIPGTYGVFVYAQDTQGTQASFTFAFTVNTNDSPLSVSCTPSASSVQLGQNYTFTAQGQGGTPGYTYNWTSYSTGTNLGTTPAIALRASTLGTYIADVSVQDSTGVSASTACSISVQPQTTTPATMISPTPGSQLTGNSEIFQWGDGEGVTQYALMIGSTAGGSDLFNANTALTDYATVTGLPTDGRTLYVTLSSFIAGSWTSNSYTYQAVSTASSLPIVPAPYVETVAGPAPASFTITVSSSTGLSGTVGFTISGAPTGWPVSVNPPTLNGSSSTVLTITPPVNSATGIFPVVVTASNGSQSVTTVVTLNVVAAAPATLTSPANGGMLMGGTAATFTWDAGYGATQYQLNLGSTPGASDIASQYTSATQSLLLPLPCWEGSQIYVTLNSLVNGAWISSGYEYPWCDCGVSPGGGGGGGVGSGVAPAPAFQLVSAEPNVLNNGQQQIGTYEIYDANTGAPLAASSIDNGSLLACGQTCGQVSAQISNTNGPLFDVTFTAAFRTTPGQETLNLTWNGIGASLSNAVQVDDGTPVIYGVWPPSIPPSQTNALISLYGTNFGPSPGSIAICTVPSDPCSGTSAVQVASIPYWSDNQVNVLVNTSATATGTYYVQLTSGGELPTSGFVSAPNGQSSAQSNFIPFQIEPIVNGLPTTITYNGATIASSYSGANCANCSVVVGQQITLTGSPSGGIWQIDGTYFNQWSSNTPPPDENPTPAILTSPSVSFYWVPDGSFSGSTYTQSTFTVTYTFNGATASVPFTVQSPQFSVVPKTSNPTIPPNSGQLVAVMSIPSYVSSPPAGEYSWLQLLTSSSAVASGSGLPNWTCSPPAPVGTPGPGQPPWLDGGGFPYLNLEDENFSDTPSFSFSKVPSGYTKLVWTKVFETYLFWTPSVSGISYAVPLWEVQWSVSATANLSTSWTVSPTDDSTSVQQINTSPTGGTTGAAVAYPARWTTVLTAIPPTQDFCQTQ